MFLLVCVLMVLFFLVFLCRVQAQQTVWDDEFDDSGHFSHTHHPPLKKCLPFFEKKKKNISPKAFSTPPPSSEAAKLLGGDMHHELCEEALVFHLPRSTQHLGCGSGRKKYADISWFLEFYRVLYYCCFYYYCYY